MRNFISILSRFHVLIFFVAMQLLSVSLLIRFNRSHQARYLETAYHFTGSINSLYTRVISYFQLAENNAALAAENSRLRNQLASNNAALPTGVREVSMPAVDSGKIIRKYLWRPARVINNSVSAQNNFITILRGRLQGIAPEMAVVSAGGIVGIVSDVSDNMAVVKSLLHRKSTTSVMLKNSETTGLLEWDGVSDRLLQLRGIPKSTAIRVGDTVVTSRISLNYPAGLLVGTITSIDNKADGSYYRLQITPAARFRYLDYVDVIENLLLSEQLDIENKAGRQQ